MAGRAIAAIGVVLAFVGIWIDAVSGSSYWDFDGTIAAAGIALAAIAALLIIAGHMGRTAGSAALFACGAVLIGYWGWFPAATAFDDWDQTRAGMWLCLAGGILIALGAAISMLAEGSISSTPAGMSQSAIVAAIGIVLVFPGVFMNASSGQSYWDGPLGHSLGIVMLILAIGAALLWAASYMGLSTRGLDAAVTLILLGIVAFAPIGAAFNNFGSLDAGAWIALAGGILAAGGIWAARGAEAPHAAAAAA